MAKNRKAPSLVRWASLIAGVVLVVQMAATFFCTNSRRFSVQAYLMNWSIAASVYFAWRLRQLWWLLVPVVLKALFALLYVRCGNVQPYITTEYLYSDYFENITSDSKCCTFYTEGDYTGVAPVDTRDLGPANEQQVLHWGMDQYARANTGHAHMLDKGTMDRAQQNKFAWIVRTLRINSDSRVLELGFGKTDLMRYIRDTTGATVEGTNLSSAQLAEARAQGFRCHEISHNDLHTHTAELGQYDVIIANGTTEYLVQAGQRDGPVYDAFVGAIQRLLRPGGLWYTTTIHINRTDAGRGSLVVDYLRNGRSLKDFYNLYMLAVGNEGSYPAQPDGMTKYARRHGLRTVLQQDRTLDYLCYSVNWMACQLHARHRRSAMAHIKSAVKHLMCWIAAPNYLESYACYTAVKDPTMLPWLWQFVRQPNGFRPATHNWIVFAKE